MPATAYDGLMDRLGERIEESISEDPFQRDRAFLSRLLPLMEVYGRYFGAEVEGWHSLPESGPSTPLPDPN